MSELNSNKDIFERLAMVANRLARSEYGLEDEGDEICRVEQQLYCKENIYK